MEGVVLRTLQGCLLLSPKTWAWTLGQYASAVPTPATSSTFSSFFLPLPLTLHLVPCMWNIDAYMSLSCSMSPSFHVLYFFFLPLSFFWCVQSLWGAQRNGPGQGEVGGRVPSLRELPALGQLGAPWGGLAMKGAVVPSSCGLRGSQ